MSYRIHNHSCNPFWARTNQDKWYLGLAAKIWSVILKLFLCKCYVFKRIAVHEVLSNAFTEKKVIHIHTIVVLLEKTRMERETKENKLLYKSTASICVSFRDSSRWNMAGVNVGNGFCRFSTAPPADDVAFTTIGLGNSRSRKKSTISNRNKFEIAKNLIVVEAAKNNLESFLEDTISRQQLPKGWEWHGNTSILVYRDLSSCCLHECAVTRSANDCSSSFR